MPDPFKKSSLVLPNDRNYFIMSVDVDGWSSLLNFYQVEHDPVEAARLVDVNKGIETLLEIFRQHEVEATFFMAGIIAKANRHSVRKIADEGHELGCHGLTHARNEFNLDSSMQRHSIEEATRIIMEISGTRPLGFRAPCLTFNQDTVRTLIENDYLYDSSVTPSYIPGYYGVPGALNRPYRISLDDRQGQCEGELIELPVSINPLIPLPLSAAWMRNLGANWVKLGVKINFRLGNPVTFYVHPRDVSVLPKTSGVPWHLYRNTDIKCVETLHKIISYVKKNRGKILSGIDYLKLLNVSNNH